ncbi:50S ribosomal protein L14e [Nanoarchaeota archaeon]
MRMQITDSVVLIGGKKMIDVGRLCVKIAGRDAGKKCVIVEVVDDRFVIVDGETRRRKCNMKHLEMLQETMDIKKGASHDDVAKEFKKLGIELKESKPRKAKPRPTQIRAAERKKMKPKPAPKKEKAPAKAEKKAEAKEEQPEKEETKLEKAISSEEK